MGAEAFLAAQILDFAEATDDRVAALLQAGTGITLTYNDGAGTLTIAAASSFDGSFAALTGKPTTLSGYGITDAQPLDSDLTAIAALTTTTFGRSLLTQADAAATRSTIGLGTLATQNGTISNYLLLAGGTMTGKITATGIGNTTGGIGNGDNGIDFFQGVIIYNGQSGTSNATYPAYFCFGQSTSKLKLSSNTQIQWDVSDPTATRNNGNLALVWNATGQLDVRGNSGLRIRNLANSADAAFSASSGVFSAIVTVGTYTVATLPSAAANAGALAQVTDSSVTTNGSAVAGGGSNRVVVFSNGSTWDVVVA